MQTASRARGRRGKSGNSFELFRDSTIKAAPLSSPACPTWQYNNEQPQAFSLNAPANAIISKDCTPAKGSSLCFIADRRRAASLSDVLMQCQTLLSSPQSHPLVPANFLPKKSSERGTILSENCWLSRSKKWTRHASVRRRTLFSLWCPSRSLFSSSLGCWCFQERGWERGNQQVLLTL